MDRVRLGLHRHFSERRVELGDRESSRAHGKRELIVHVPDADLVAVAGVGRSPDIRAGRPNIGPGSVAPDRNIFGDRADFGAVPEQQELDQRATGDVAEGPGDVMLRP